MSELKRQLAIVIIGALLFLGYAYYAHAWEYCVDIGGSQYCFDVPDE